MSEKGFTESEVENAALTWFEELGYTHIHGPDIADDGPTPQRSSYQDVVLEGRLRDALTRLNPTIPADARDVALRKVTRPENASLLVNNRAFHEMLVDGALVEYQRPDSAVAGDRARKEQIPSRFVFDEALLGSDGLEASIGSLKTSPARAAL